jgi:hypothetical protein
MSNPKKSYSIIGRFFHTFEETSSGRKRLLCQGYGRARVEEGLYLVQYFEWFMGEASTMKLVRVEDMLAWQFYEDAEHMKFWYEHRYHAPAEDNEQEAA